MAARVVDGALSRRSIELPSSYTIPPVLSPAALRACLCLSLLPILSLLSSSRSPLHPTPTAYDSSLVVATFMCKAKRIPPIMASYDFTILPPTHTHGDDTTRHGTIRYDCQTPAPGLCAIRCNSARRFSCDRSRVFIAGARAAQAVQGLGGAASTWRPPAGAAWLPSGWRSSCSAPPRAVQGSRGSPPGCPAGGAPHLRRSAAQPATLR